MTTPDLERRLTDVLRRQAEEAMNRTDTNAERQRFQTRVSPQSTAGTPRWVVAAAAALTAAAMALGTIWYSDLVTAPDGGPVRPDRPTQSADERVAQRFAEAFEAGDDERAATFLAEGASVPQGWRDWARLDQAFSYDSDLEPCQTASTSEFGTFVECLSYFHALHSEQLGLGPFGPNVLTVVVADGEVRTFRLSVSGVGGEEELFQDFGTWVRENHPGEWAFLRTQWSLVGGPPVGDEKTSFRGTLTPSEVDRWIQLWQQRSQEYADEMTGG